MRVKEVFKDDSIVRQLGGNAFIMKDAPADGVVLYENNDTGVYIRFSDLEKILEERGSGFEMKFDSWDGDEAK